MYMEGRFLTASSFQVSIKHTRGNNVQKGKGISWMGKINKQTWCAEISPLEELVEEQSATEIPRFVRHRLCLGEQ